MKKTNLFISALLFISVLAFTSCRKEKETTKLVSIEDFIGTYVLGDGSYILPFDDSGNPITSEKRSMADQVVSLVRCNGDTLIFSSPSLGRIKAKSYIEGTRLRLDIRCQPYNGDLMSPTGEMLEIKALDNFYFDKEPGRGRFFDAEPGQGRFEISTPASGGSRIAGGKKYELQVRCCPRTS